MSNTQSATEPLISHVCDYVRSMRTDKGSYRLAEGIEGSLYATCFAIFILKLVNRLDDLSNLERDSLTQQLISRQDRETGYFREDLPRLRGMHKRHDPEHLDRQLTTFALSALSALGEKPRFELQFMEQFRGPVAIGDWLSSLDWIHDSWNSGSRAMFIAIFLTILAEEGDNEFRVALEAWFDWLNDRQRSESGFWGETRASDYHQGMCGAYHLFILYYYWNRPIQYADRVVRQTLKMQQPDGLFCPQQGGASCDDLDAIDILVHFDEFYSIEPARTRQSLRRAYETIVALQRDDGGFPWTVRKKLGAADWLAIVGELPRHRDVEWLLRNIKHAWLGQKELPMTITLGWANKSRNAHESSLFDTWFRLLGLAKISKHIDTPLSNYPWNFLKTPGLGWFGSK